MQDNVRLHAAQVVGNYLEEVGINTMEWSPSFPDLNPIENLWDILNGQLRAK